MNGAFHQFAWRSALAGVILFAVPGSAIAEGGLKVGEYACYGSGGTLLIGLGFKVLDDSAYGDLDGKESGKITIDGSTVYFQGGHLDGYVGTNLEDEKFNIRTVSCEPFG